MTYLVIIDTAFSEVLQVSTFQQYDTVLRPWKVVQSLVGMTVLQVYYSCLFLYSSPVPFDVSTSPNCLSLAKGIMWLSLYIV